MNTNSPKTGKSTNKTRLYAPLQHGAHVGAFCAIWEIKMLIKIKSIESQADNMIKEKTGLANFSGVYTWHNGIAGAYVSSIVETAKGAFCVQYWKRRNLVQLHIESQPGIFTPIASQSI